MIQVLEHFDKYLTRNSYQFEGIVIGGSALSVMGIISRHTVDVDFLSPKIPNRLRELAFDFANEFPEYGLNPSDWINNGPESLISDLSSGWESRIQIIFKGISLKLFTLGRDELLFSKVWAYIDRGTDLNDCIGLSPTVDELDRLVVFISSKDANPQWPAHVETMISKLKRALGYD